MFKVVSDQLRISEGWVRCGQCDEVFDANTHLQPPELHEIPTPAPVPVSPVVIQESVAGPLLPAYDWSPIISGPYAQPVPQVDVLGLPVDLEGIVPGDDVLTERPMRSVVQVSSEALSGAAIPENQENPPASFLNGGSNTFSPQRRSVAILLAMFSVVLLAVLVVQVLVQERDRIVATEPTAKVLLEPLCAVMGCRISLLKQIDSILIESSAFTKVRPDLYRLSFVIKNTAPIDLATPAVELTLTDMQDQTLVRRVLTARELNTQTQILAARGEWGASQSVSVKLPRDTDHIAGYRLLIFYP